MYPFSDSQDEYYVEYDLIFLVYLILDLLNLVFDYLAYLSAFQLSEDYVPQLQG